MELTAPLWLVAAVLAAAGLGWTAWRNGWGRQRAVLAAAAGLLCGAAPAGPALRSATGPVRIVALDDSGSMRGSAVDAAERLAPALGAGGARVGVVRFAGQASVARTPDTTPLTFAAEPDRTAGRTDVAAALRRATELLPRAGGEVVLLTDGRLTPGALAAVATAGRALRARGGRLAVVPAGASTGDDAAAWSLRGPSHAAPGATIRCALTVRLSRVGAARFQLELDGRPVHAGELTGRPNELHRTVVDVAMPGTPGTARVRLLAGAGPEAGAPDAVPQNGARELLVTLGSERTVWLCSERRGLEAAGELVRAAGATLALRRPRDMPVQPSAYAGVEAVILWDASPSRFPDGALRALAQYVRDGGGLLQLGGPAAFGLAGFGGDPLESVTAVKSDPRSERPLALALVLDASGSMAEPVNPADPAAGAKMDAARAAVESALEQLRPQDRLYIVPFREGALAPIELAAGGAGNAAALRDALTARGGTHIRPAVERAAQWLEQATEPARQLVVISDGRDPRLAAGAPDREAVAAVLLRLQSSEIGASLLTSAQQSGLEQLIGGVQGRIGRLMRFGGVEELLGRELRLSRGSLEWTGTAEPEREAAVAGLPLPERLPFVQRANRTALNDGARSLLRLPGDEPAPLLAAREVGHGRSAAFTSAAISGWATPESSGVIANALSYVLAAERAGDAALRAAVTEHGVRVDARWVGAAPADGRVLDLLDGERRIAFEPVAPGRYRAVAPPAPEARLVTIAERAGDDERPLGRLALPGGWAPEWGGTGIDLDGCHRLARAAGGVAVDDALLWRPLPLPGEAPRPIGGWLLGAGLLLLLALFGWRRR